MKTYCRTLLAGSLLFSLITGCESSKKTVPVAYSPRITVTDFAGDLDMPTDYYHLLREEDTVGRFPASLAVAKIAAMTDGDQVSVYLTEMEATEQSRWAEAFRGVNGVRGLTFLSPISIRSVRKQREALCATAVDLGADYLLEYAPGKIGPNSAEILGVLYDAQLCTPIATIHQHELITNTNGQEVPPMEMLDEADDMYDDVPNDVRPFDAYYQASRAFELSAVDCIRALIVHDSSSAFPEAHRWTPEPK